MKKNNFPPVRRLKYNQGDLIIKEGDFGLSIYEIIKGEVDIFVNSNGKDIKVATLGTGMIVGGMAFISGDTAVRVASARAKDDTVLDVWHPAILKDDYKRLPKIFKLIAGQALKRLVRMNNAVSKLIDQKESSDNAIDTDADKDTGDRRKYYRKQVDLGCTYRPVDSSPKATELKGRVKDISRGGLQLEVSMINSTDYPHNPGERFVLHISLVSDKELTATAKIISVNDASVDGRLRLGMAFTHLTHDDKKHLGFFLMP